MKKTYQKPQMVCTFIQMQQVICGSLSSTNVDGLGYGGNSDDAGIVTGNANRSVLWGDDENH